MKCPVCKKEIVPKNSLHIYCSKPCRQKAFRYKNRIRLKKEREDWPSYNNWSKKKELLKAGVKEICVFCGRTNALVVHHRDLNRDNNDFDNLVFICFGCHFILHNYVLKK